MQSLQYPYPWNPVLVYRTCPSPYSEMTPPFAALHGDVEGVVRHIRTAAKSQPAKPIHATDAGEHSQKRLVAKMVRILEAACA